MRFRVLRASWKAKIKPPDGMFPFCVASLDDKLNALRTARNILHSKTDKSEGLLKLAKWWYYYFDIDPEDKVSWLRNSLVFYFKEEEIDVEST